MASNKNSATEDEVGLLHGLITKCHNLKAGKMLELATSLIETGADLDEICLVLDNKQLTSAQKWVEYNQVGCSIAEENEESELSKRLREVREAQKGKVVSFTDIQEAANK